jgi:hypothetical protein
MAPELPRSIAWLLRLLHVSEAVTGDLAEEWRDGNRNTRWLCEKP